MTSVRFSDQEGLQGQGQVVQVDVKDANVTCAHVICTMAARDYNRTKGIARLEHDMALQLAWANSAQLQRSFRESFYPPRDNVLRQGNDLLCQVVNQTAGLLNSHVAITAHDKYMAFLEPGEALRMGALLSSPAPSHVVRILDVTNAFIGNTTTFIKVRGTPSPRREAA